MPDPTIVSETKPWRDAAARPHLEVRGVVKRFGGTPAVDGVSLGIHRGEFFALLGPSGCGKTTLLRMLAGFEEPDEGAILLDGEDIVGVPPHERPVNMMFQSYALFPHMTVERNVEFGLQMEGMARSERRARVAEMLALVDLERLARRRPDQLSGGQRQRVALARALAKRPKLLLLDEPLGALDRKLREQTQLELVRIQESLGLTFVIVTHDQEEAMTVSTRLAVMRDGRIAQLGEPREVYEAPRSRYVAEFIGDVNILEGRVAEGGFALACGGRTDPGRAIAETTRALALRPEKIEIFRTERASGAVNSLGGIVADIAYLGDFSIYHVRIGAEGPILRVARANRHRAEAPIGWDDPVEISWDASDLVPLQDG